MNDISYEFKVKTMNRELQTSRVRAFERDVEVLILPPFLYTPNTLQTTLSQGTTKCLKVLSMKGGGGILHSVLMSFDFNQGFQI